MGGRSRSVGNEVLGAEIVYLFDGAGELRLDEGQEDVEVLELNGARAEGARLDPKL